MSLGLAALPASILCLGGLVLPESPSYLIEKCAGGWGWPVLFLHLPLASPAGSSSPAPPAHLSSHVPCAPPPLFITTCRGRHAEGMEVLRMLRGVDEVDAEYADIVESAQVVSAG